MKLSLEKNIFTMPLAAVLSFIMIVTLVGIFSGCSHYTKESPSLRAEMAVKFDEQDYLIQPKGYREWIFVGTPLTPNDMNKGKASFPEFHNVYIEQKNFAEYKKTGKFPDGTILVKELLSVGSKKAASGNGYFMGEPIGLEATLKDSKRYPGEPGNWAYFSFTTEHGKPFKEKAKAFPTSSCNACHQAFAEEDWVFTQYYPVLRAAMKESPRQVEEMAVKFDEQDNLIQPEGYREWIFVGAPITPNDMNKGKAPFPEFHTVYIEQKNFTEYKKTGKFPDGTILVKELLSVGSKKAASGHGYFMGEPIGLEATLKDSKRYPNEPGNWVYFSFTTEHGKPFKEKVKASPTSACNACHEAFAEEDWVFTQYYPVLRAAKPK